MPHARRSFLSAALAVLPILAFQSAPAHGQAMSHGAHGAAGAWRMPPMDSLMPAMPGMDTLQPHTTAFLPGKGVDAKKIPAAVPSRPVSLQDGDTLRLDARLVTRVLHGRQVVMYGFNGQYPGPLIRVPQNATIVVQFRNSTEWPTAVHWHGVRLDNSSDGVPGVTQEPVQPGAAFTYRVHFRDAGIYWYHPHHREDVQQDLGLYGSILVASQAPGYWNQVDHEQVLMLDDLLIDEKGIFPYGGDTPGFALMGRTGNVLLVNGEPRYELSVHKGDVVRFFLTNASSTRTFNVTFGDAVIKLIASDVGRFEHEQLVESVVLAPAERYVVEVQFARPGVYAVMNRVQALNHPLGEFFPETDTLGLVRVDSTQGGAAASARTFQAAKRHEPEAAEIARLTAALDTVPQKELQLTLRLDSVAPVLNALMLFDTTYFHPVEWTDPMPMMNWLFTGREVHWELRDTRTARINDAIDWHFKRGELVRVRLVNPVTGVLHAMQHPIHFHGQRFIVLAKDGVKNENRAWKDTVLVPAGSTVDILLEASNPGRWMAHCHIAEHLSTGMSFVFTVD